MTNILVLQPDALAEYQELLNGIKQHVVSVRLRPPVWVLYEH